VYLGVYDNSLLTGEAPGVYDDSSLTGEAPHGACNPYDGCGAGERMGGHLLVLMRILNMVFISPLLEVSF